MEWLEELKKINDMAVVESRCEPVLKQIETLTEQAKQQLKLFVIEIATHKYDDNDLTIVLSELPADCVSLVFAILLKLKIYQKYDLFSINQDLLKIYTKDIKKSLNHSIKRAKRGYCEDSRPLTFEECYSVAKASGADWHTLSAQDGQDKLLSNLSALKKLYLDPTKRNDSYVSKHLDKYLKRAMVQLETIRNQTQSISC